MKDVANCLLHVLNWLVEDPIMKCTMLVSMCMFVKMAIRPWNK